jgi:hypothetical protein
MSWLIDGVILAGILIVVGFFGVKAYRRQKGIDG